MTDQEFEQTLHAAAERERNATFSPTLHARVMMDIHDQARHSKSDVRSAVRWSTWRWGGAAIAAMVLVAVGIALLPSDRPATLPPPQPGTPIGAVAVFSVPDDLVARGAANAEAKLDALVEAQQLAAIDRDAVRFTQFVLDQLTAAAPTHVVR